MTERAGGDGPLEVDACVGAHMGNDITPPMPARDDEPAGRPPTTSTSHGDRGSPPPSATSSSTTGGAVAQPPASFADVARFRDLPPLRAARGYARRAIESASRAEWESGVARQASMAGDALLARDVADSAVRHANSAQFFVALMRSALDQWMREREGAGAAVSIGLDGIVERAERATARARATSDEADVIATHECLRRAGRPEGRARRGAG